ncbi:MAG: FG-GAP repeat protein [Ferruginibacter sp.]|nr:FG-GAP repeat protein [Ferruginibacter sp.]
MKKIIFLIVVSVLLVGFVKAQNVGIGTATPQKKLHVFQGSSGGSFFTNSTVVLESNTTNILQFANASTSIAGIYSGSNLTTQRSAIKFEADSSVIFTSGGTLNRMKLDNRGYLGINETSPTAYLHVSGGGSGNASLFTNRTAIFEDNNTSYIQLLNPNASETGILVGNASTSIKSGIIFTADSSVYIRAGGNNTRIAVTDNGNTGIATTTPLQKLDVNGKIKVGDDVATPVAGTIRWNTSLNDFEGFNGTEWLSFTGSRNAVTIGTNEDQGQLTNYRAITAPTLGAENRVGDDIDIDGEWAVVGSRVEDIGGLNAAGVAHIYRLVGQNWQYFSTVQASDAAVEDFFGTSVAISGNYIIVGAPTKTNVSLVDQGAAYVFFYNGTTWAQQAKLFNGAGEADAFWGYDVDISGSTIIIGASQADDFSNTDEGKAYIFKRSGTIWSQTAVFTGSGNGPFAYFGSSVSLDETGNYAVIGAPIAEAVFVFFFNGSSWLQQVKILPPIGAPPNELFGLSVAVSSNTFIVGAPGSTFDTGRAYIYTRIGTAWSQQALLNFSNTRNFGSSVAIEGDFVMIGEPNAAQYNVCGTSTGALKGKVHIMKRTNNIWESYLKFSTPDGFVSDQFGADITIDNLNVGFTAPTADANGVTNSGKIVFGKLR